LIDLIINQKIQEGDFVFVESIDRLSRQKMRLSKDLVYTILDRGVTLVTTIDGQMYSRAKDGMEQDIMLSVIAQRAHEESKTKSIHIPVSLKIFSGSRSIPCCLVMAWIEAI
jgi:DNA invertase Pin-like site-specific DNA recombinase